jgi:hypothetical protein
MMQMQERARMLAREVEQKTEAFARTTRNFDTAVQVVKRRLMGDKAKVQRYLAGDGIEDRPEIHASSQEIK